MNIIRVLCFSVFLLSLVLSVVSCGQQPSAAIPSEGVQSDTSSIVHQEYPVHIQLSGSEEYMNTLTLSDLASDIQYIPLETNPACLLGDIRRSEIAQEYIFIQSGGGTLVQFDRQGKYLRRINKTGKGPGECVTRFFGIDEKNRLVYIFDSKTLDVFSFTFDGQFVKTIHNPLCGMPGGDPSGFVFDKTQGNFFFFFNNFHGDMPYKYGVTDSNGIVLYKCPNYDQVQSARTHSQYMVTFDAPIFQHDSSYYYSYEYNDTVFVINEDYTCSPVYIRSLPRRITLKDDLELSRKDLVNSYSGMEEDDKYVYLYHFFMTGNGILPFLSLYEKRTGAILENINRLFVNDWDGGMDVKLSAFIQNGNQFRVVLEPYNMINTLTAEHFASTKVTHPEKADALKKLVNTLKEEDNPVLMIITTKQL